MKATALLITGLGRGRFDRGDLESMPGIVDDAVPVASILDRSSVDETARYCSVVSRDGQYTASIPLDELTDGGWLAFAVPPEEGGPLRLRVVDGSTLCWNVKDVGELRLTVDHEPDSIPESPPH